MQKIEKTVKQMLVYLLPNFKIINKWPTLSVTFMSCFSVPTAHTNTEMIMKPIPEFHNLLRSFLGAI